MLGQGSYLRINSFVSSVKKLIKSFVRHFAELMPIRVWISSDSLPLVQIGDVVVVNFGIERLDIFSSISPLEKPCALRKTSCAIRYVWLRLL